MRLPTLTREAVVGIIFMVVLLILAALTFVIDEEGYTLSDPFDRQYRCRVPDTVQIEPGDTVRQCGMRAGRIDATEVISAGDRFAVEIAFSMKQPFKVRRDSVVTLATTSLLQKLSLEVSPGSSDAEELQPGSLVPSVKTPRVSEVFSSVDRALDDLPDGGLGRMALGEGGFKDVGTVLDTLASDGGMGSWLMGESNLGKMEPITAELRNAVGNVRRGTEGRGVLARLLSDNALGRAVDEMVVDLREGARGVRRLGTDLAAGKSVLSRLAVDEPMGDRVDGIFTDLGVVARDLHTSRSGLALLIRDEEMGTQLAGAIEGISRFAADLASGRGVIGKLVESPEIYDQGIRLVREVREAIEDAREAAPISIMSGLVQSAAESLVTGD